jgi:hypothetical protein
MLMIFVLAVIAALVGWWALGKYLETPESDWSNWKAIKHQGEPCFRRNKRTSVYSDDMMLDNPIIPCQEEQLFKLSDFVGRGHKPVTKNIWRIHYYTMLPYLWHDGI